MPSSETRPPGDRPSTGSNNRRSAAWAGSCWQTTSRSGPLGASLDHRTWSCQPSDPASGPTLQHASTTQRGGSRRLAAPHTAAHGLPSTRGPAQIRAADRDHDRPGRAPATVLRRSTSRRPRRHAGLRPARRTRAARGTATHRPGAHRLPLPSRRRRPRGSARL